MTTIAVVLLSIALPSASGMLRAYRASGDARSVASTLALAKMRAAAGYTHARVAFDTANRSYWVEVWDKASSAYVVEGGVQRLSQQVSFDYGTLSTPAGTQTIIAQSPRITFNSRGVPIDDSGAPSGTGGVYLADSAGHYFAVTAAASSRISTWRHSGTAWKQF